MGEVKTWEIWSEGYAATGEQQPAHFYGTAEGETFEEACENFRQPEDLVRSWDGFIMVHKGDPLNLDRNENGGFRYGYPSIWACRLYDNETDARKRYG